MLVQFKGNTPWSITRSRYLRFKIKSSDRVLDLGCGEGMGISILKEIGIYNIVGLDELQKESIEEAKRIHPDIEFVVGSAEKLPFRDRSFDIVLVDSVFHHLKDYQKCIKEIYRVLVKGGKLCFIEPHRSIWREFLDFVTILSISQFLPFFKRRQKRYLIEKQLMDNWLQNEQIFLNLIEKQGFKKEFLRVDLLSIIAKYQKT